MITLKEVQKSLKSKKAAILSKKIPCDLITPVGSIIKLKKHFEDYHFLYESVEKGSNKGRYSVIGLKPDLVFKSIENEVLINHDFEDDKDNFEKITDRNPLNILRELVKESQIKDDSFLSSGLFGYMSYDMVRLMEDIGSGDLKDEINIPDSFFIRPQILIIFDSLFDLATICAPIYFKEGINAKLAYENANKNIEDVIEIISKKSDLLPKTEKKEYKFSFSASEKEYCKMVEKSKKYIKEGDIFQVLPSLRASADFSEEDSIAFYRSLRSINPSPFLFYLKFPDFSFIGSSPEIMVSLKDNKVTVRPLAGTRKRGKTLEEDQEIAQDLLSDKKELAEHLMLIDLGRHDVGRVCKANSINVTEKMVIENYSHVMHIGSNVEGELKEGMDAIDALMSGFPAGTVSGAPKIRAMQIIEELESLKRSFYAGCVGYFSGNGDMETCITLRSALIKNGKIYLQAGAGVVYDSVPKLEYQECHNKLAALMTAVDQIYKY